MIRTYGKIVLADFESSGVEDWDFQSANVARVRLPALAETVVEMQRRGFIWADRTLKATIRLQKLPVDPTRLIRLPIEETGQNRDDILRIAKESFAYDRRFHLRPDCHPEIAATVLAETMRELPCFWVAKFKEKVVGFLALRETAPDTTYVALAAVEEKYRITGAALSLYAKACLVSAERNYRKLDGRISSMNTAVMNIYASFGAVFSEPVDIFLKEIQ